MLPVLSVSFVPALVVLRGQFRPRRACRRAAHMADNHLPALAMRSAQDEIARNKIVKPYQDQNKVRRAVAIRIHENVGKVIRST